MRDDTEEGPPFDPAEIGPLLTGRWPIHDDERVTVEVEDERRLRISLLGPRHRYAVSARLIDGPTGDEGWTLLVDALDLIFGQLIESDRDYRSLPAGTDVAFRGATLEVIVEHSVPELDKLADQILNGN